jgi:hypothetical protein
MRPLARSIHILARIAAIALLFWVPLNLVDVKQAAAQLESVSVEFRTALEPYGTFEHVARWGEVWVPNNVRRDWRPYTVGHWVYSDDYGWYWASDQSEAPWGWIVFHYGRWVFNDDLGWVWVPGREWGPAWVDWRRGARYFGWAPLPPEEIIVDVRDEPQYWIFVEPADFLAADIANVFIEPEPVFFSETVVVNETFVLRDRGFAVNPGIEPSFVGAAIGRPVPEFQVRPRVLAGTAAALPGAMQVSAQDLRRSDFRQSLVQQTNIRATNNTIRPAASVPRPQSLDRNERGRLGQTPPRAASGVAQQAPQQPGTTGAAPGQQQRGVTGAQQPRQPERGATGAPLEQQRGLRERGATGPMPSEQQRKLYDRAPPSGPTPEERTPRERGAIAPAPEQKRGVQERELQQRGMQERGATGALPREERQLYNRAPSGPAPELQRGPRERGGAIGPPPGQPGQERGLRERGATGPSQGGGQERQLFNRAPSGSGGGGPPRGLGERGGGGGPSAGGPNAGPGPGSGGGEHRGHEQ